MPVSSVISDLTVKSPSRLLAEALRVKLGESPDSYLIEPAAGSLVIDRAYLPIFQLLDTGITVVSLIPQDQAGEINTRSGSYRSRRTVTAMVSVQRLLEFDPQTEDGKSALDDMMDYSERVLRACLEAVGDLEGMPAAPSAFDSTGHNQDALKEWNQFAEVHSFAYEVLA